jgi:hypothetical protein
VGVGPGRALPATVEALGAIHFAPPAARTGTKVSRAFPSCTRSILTEIYLCHACSCHEIKADNAWTGHRPHGALPRARAARGQPQDTAGAAGGDMHIMHTYFHPCARPVANLWPIARLTHGRRCATHATRSRLATRCCWTGRSRAVLGETPSAAHTWTTAWVGEVDHPQLTTGAQLTKTPRPAGTACARAASWWRSSPSAWRRARSATTCAACLPSPPTRRSGASARGCWLRCGGRCVLFGSLFVLG